jgi:hypothetical protein
MNSGFDDWIYWHFFTITITNDNSHIELRLNDVSLTNLYRLKSPRPNSQLPLSQVKVTLRLTVSQWVSLGIEPHLGPMTRYLFLSDSYVLVSVGRPLWREDGSVFCTCPWPLPAQPFSGPSLLGLATVFYCLRFETSHFVASYDLRGHGGGIRPRLHTGDSLCLSVESESNVTTEGQSASLSWYKAPIQGLRPDFFFRSEYVWQLRSWFRGAPSLTRGRVCLLYVPLALASAVFLVPSPLGLATVFYCLRFETSLFVASYDSQGHCEGIRPRLHTGVSPASQLFCEPRYIAAARTT